MDEGVVQIRIIKPSSRGGQVTIVKKTTVRGITVKTFAKGKTAREALDAAATAADEQRKRIEDQQARNRELRNDLLS